MKLLVTANCVPFVQGGAESHLQGLVNRLRAHGHQVETLRFPFRFQPETFLGHLMDFCERCDLDGLGIDRVISLQFPGYGVRHPDHVVWLMHQHRAVYELYGREPPTPELERLREQVRAYDHRVLPRARRRYANSRRVAERLRHYNGLEAAPLYHPPPGAERFFSAAARPYVFFPSRLERLKRQDLLIEAARHLRTPLAVLIAGEGGQYGYYRELIRRHGLEKRVRLLGRCDEAEKHVYYAHCLAVFYGPHDEDYGYVTLEAMLSAKPVLTCTDSGGPLELVVDGETGFVLPPAPQSIAAALDRLYEDRSLAERLGAAGLARYRALDITWENVITALLQ